LAKAAAETPWLTDDELKSRLCEHADVLYAALRLTFELLSPGQAQQHSSSGSSSGSNDGSSSSSSRSNRCEDSSSSDSGGSSSGNGLSSAQLQEQQRLQQLAGESLVVLRPLLLHWLMSQLDVLLLQSDSYIAGALVQSLATLLTLTRIADTSEAVAVKCTALRPLFQSVLPHVLLIVDNPVDSAQTTSSSSSSSAGSGGSSSGGSRSGGSSQTAKLDQEMLREDVPCLEQLLPAAVDGCECYW
jgi:hypothetical protein